MGGRVQSQIAGGWKSQIHVVQVAGAARQGDEGLRTARTLAQGNEEDGALPFRVRRKKADDIVVIECQARCAETLSVSGDIELSAQDPCFQLRCPVAAIAKTFENLVEV